MVSTTVATPLLGTEELRKRVGPRSIVVFSLLASIPVLLCVSLVLGDQVVPPTVLNMVTAVPLAAVGALLVLKRRGGVLGWLLLIGCIGQVLGDALYPNVHRADMSATGMRWMAWISQEAHIQSM